MEVVVEAPLSAVPPPAAQVLGVPVWGLSTGDLVELAVRLIRLRYPAIFTTANAHSIVVAQRTPEFLAHFREATVVLPDGVLPLWAGRLSGGKLCERVAGPDFVDAFLAAASSERLNVFFMGSTEQTLARLSENLGRRHPGWKLSGTLAPPFGPFSAATDRAIISSINAARPDALFVGMTAPKQELWISRNRAALDVPFVMGVGAAFDYLAGTVRRVPRGLGQLGFEWLFRLAQEPRRLWRRNLSSAVFLSLVLKAGLRARLGASSRSVPPK